MVPVGDVRNCIVALSDREDLMEQLFDYRFERGDGLDGHSLGNLLNIASTMPSTSRLGIILVNKLPGLS